MSPAPIKFSALIESANRVHARVAATGTTIANSTPGTIDPPDRRSADHDWIWGELWTRDVARAKRFYAAVTGYESREIQQADDASYTVLFNDGKPKTGVVALPWEDVLPHWLPYLRVTDIDETIARVETAGGAVLLAPSEQYDEGSVAIVSDPTGGVFAIQAPRTTE